MKSYAEITNDINVEYKKIENLKKQLDNVSKEKGNYIESLVPDGTKFEQFEAAKSNSRVWTYRKQKDEIEKKIAARKLAVTVLRTNADVALFHEVISSIVSVFNQYKGKRIGEKRNAEIRKKIEKAANVTIRCSLYSFVISKSSYYHLDVFLSKEWLDKDGKLNEFEEKDFSLPEKYKYIVNVEEYICYIQNLINRIEETNNKLNKLIKEYDEIAVEGFPNFVKNYEHYSLDSLNF